MKPGVEFLAGVSARITAPFPDNSPDYRNWERIQLSCTAAPSDVSRYVDRVNQPLPVPFEFEVPGGKVPQSGYVVCNLSNNMARESS